MCRVKGSLETGFSALRLGKAGLAGRSRLVVLGADLGDLLLSGLVAGIDFGGAQKFHQRPLLISPRHQLAALHQVSPRCRNPHPVERRAVLQILGIFGVGLLVAVEGGVVIFTRLGGLAALEQGAGRLRTIADTAPAEDGQSSQERNPEGEPRKRESGGNRNNSADFHRTPKRLSRRAYPAGPI
jgi:hypothetical protein